MIHHGRNPSSQWPHLHRPTLPIVNGRNTRWNFFPSTALVQAMVWLQVMTRCVDHFISWWDDRIPVLYVGIYFKIHDQDTFCSWNFFLQWNHTHDWRRIEVMEKNGRMWWRRIEESDGEELCVYLVQVSTPCLAWMNSWIAEEQIGCRLIEQIITDPWHTRHWWMIVSEWMGDQVARRRERLPKEARKKRLEKKKREREVRRKERDGRTDVRRWFLFHFLFTFPVLQITMTKTV